MGKNDKNKINTIIFERESEINNNIHDNMCRLLCSKETAKKFICKYLNIELFINTIDNRIGLNDNKELVIDTEPRGGCRDNELLNYNDVNDELLKIRKERDNLDIKDIIEDITIIPEFPINNYGIKGFIDIRIIFNMKKIEYKYFLYVLKDLIL